MKPSTDGEELPGALRSLRRTLSVGYRAEPRLLLASFGMVVISALPDALIALWLALIVHGLDEADRSLVVGAAFGLAASAVLTWYLGILMQRVSRRFRDRVSVALESHVARLQATVPTIEHQERPDYLDRLAVLRDQVFALDHLFLSLFSTAGWLVRLVVTLVLLGAVNPALLVLLVFVIPTVLTAGWRPGVERRTEERVARHNRLARHFFVLGTTAPPGKEVRVTGIAPQLVDRRDATWEQWYRPLARVRWTSAGWHALAWAVFGAAYVVAIGLVAAGDGTSAGAVILVLSAGGRLSQYVGAAVGEIGFLRGIWLDSSKRLTWLEDYARAAEAGADLPVPERLTDGIRFEHVSFRYPGTERLVLDNVNVHLPAGTVVAIVGENGAGKTTLVKLLAKMYTPTSGRILVDGSDLARLPSATWRERLAGAFQDFFRFEFTAQSTVGLGDVPRLEDRPGVERAVARAGADDVVARLPAHLDTQLGPGWEGGVEMSHGQWQKLALARGFMRDEPLVLVLDEPTSALDAETEHALFARYADASRTMTGNGRITVLISHRFSTVRMADLIVVMDGAHVVEVGSHDALMARQGQYAALYDIQAAAYRS